jgi:hypothetical protein
MWSQIATTSQGCATPRQGPPCLGFEVANCNSKESVSLLELKNARSLLMAQAETNLAFSDGRQRFHIFHLPRKAIDILHQYLDD